MEQTPAHHLRLGAWIDAIVVKPLGGRRFLVRAAQAPRGWTVELHTRTPESIVEGEHIRCWVVKVSPLHSQILLHEGDFGRLPISEAMRPRYRQGLQAVMGAIPATADNLADARGMVVRIQKQNQADWLTVWQILGEPSSGDVKRFLQVIDELREVRKTEPDRINEIIEEAVIDFGSMLELAVKQLAKPASPLSP